MDKSFLHFLFHQPKFIFRNPDTPVIGFEDRDVRIYFSRKGESLTSLESAPFGSFITDGAAIKSNLVSCLEKVISWSASNDITTIVIRSFPHAYEPEHSALIKDALSEFLFNILYADIAQVIHITPDETLNVTSHKKRRLRNAESRGFQFRALPLSFLETSYSLFVQSRNNKGYPLTMSLKGLRDMFVLFPDNYLLFGVFDKERLIAASVSIKVNAEILYCFYIGDDLEYRSHSPVTVLVNGIYEYCKAHNFRILDLGMSTDKGILNKGLYTFKKSFGTVDSPKLTFIKKL